MADDELVQGRARRDEHADRAGPASCAAELLPGRRDGARIAHQDCALQAADVDAQLERIRAHDACDVSAAQPRLYLASVQREVAGPVTAHAPRRVEARIEVLPEVAEHHLDRKAAATEHDGLHACPDPWRCNSARFEHRAAPDPEFAIDQRWVIEDEPPFAARSAAAVDEGDVLFLEQTLRQLERIADRRRRADESGVRAVEGADALQPPDDVGDLAAE